MKFETIGINSANEDELNIEDATVTVDQFEFGDAPPAIENGRGEAFEIVVTHGEEKDTEIVVIGPDGLEPSKTIGIQVESDGTISADQYITCS